MYSFFIALSLLVLSYFVYGKFIEKTFGADDNIKTPAVLMNDGVDFVEIGWKKGVLIQFLNIAGLGPIFGAMAGAMWGTASYIWIVLGCIFAGSVHDYMAGMISVRHNGSSLPELIGMYLGNFAEKISRIVLVLLLLIVGVAFVVGPAEILTNSTNISKGYWLILIVIYYILATILPINKIIGKIYPIFGAALIFMGIGILGGIIIKGYPMQELTIQNLHPKNLPIFPFMFVVISCGAISGFHATQSTLLARCIKKESDGKRVFFGAMIIEGIVALIWAAVAIAFFGGPEGIAASGGGAVAVNVITNSLLGKIGAFVSFFGIIACPISTGDTAFRSVRLTVSEFFKIKQDKVKNRVLTSLPIFAVAGLLFQVGFGTLWQYVAVTNQVLATITLWLCATYLKVEGKNHYICTIPALFMSGMIASYIAMDKVGFQLSSTAAYPLGIIFAIICGVLFFRKKTVVQKAKTI